jgi:hypothetical protein
MRTQNYNIKYIHDTQSYNIKYIHIYIKGTTTLTTSQIPFYKIEGSMTRVVIVPLNTLREIPW